MLGVCHGAADIVAIARDIDGSVMQTMYQAGVPISDGGTVALAGAWQPFAPEAVEVANASPWVRALGIERAIVSPRGIVYRTTQFVDPAAATATFAMPPTTGTQTAVRVTAYPVAGALTLQQLLVWGATVASPISFPALALAPVTTSPVYDPATHTVSWTEDAAPGGNVVRGQLHAFRDGMPAHQWDWQIAAPRTGTTLAYPELPAGDFDFMPAQADAFAVRELETANLPGGYPAVRARALRTRLDVIVPGVAGQLAYQQLFDLQE
jgi:hypothetical protein